MTPSICGSFLRDKKSLVAFTWTLTTVLTILAFIISIGLVFHTHTSYNRLEKSYQYEYQQEEANEQEEGQHSADREYYEYLQGLSELQSHSLTFTAAYTMIVALALSLYGSTAIVGFTSLRGVYIQPCFSSPSNLKVGMFGGSIVFFANLLLVSAVVLGEVRVSVVFIICRVVVLFSVCLISHIIDPTHTHTTLQVEDGRDQRGGGEGEQENNRNEDRPPYEIERIANILAVVCMFLSALYSIFAILLFLYFGDENDSRHNGKQATNDPRQENFITMDS